MCCSHYTSDNYYSHNIFSSFVHCEHISTTNILYTSSVLIVQLVLDCTCNVCCMCSHVRFLVLKMKEEHIKMFKTIKPKLFASLLMMTVALFTLVACSQSAESSIEEKQTLKVIEEGELPHSAVSSYDYKIVKDLAKGQEYILITDNEDRMVMVQRTESMSELQFIITELLAEKAKAQSATKQP